MTTFKDLEDHLKNFIIQEQSDAHNVRNVNVTKYNNIKIWMDMTKYTQPHFFVRVSISEAVFALDDCSKLNGGLGYEERFIIKWAMIIIIFILIKVIPYKILLLMQKEMI